MLLLAKRIWDAGNDQHGGRGMRQVANAFVFALVNMDGLAGLYGHGPAIRLEDVYKRQVVW